MRVDFVQTDRKAPYPRVCAHRGFNTIAPENSLPAFGAAVALGANEIEFDLWKTSDGQIVSIHDVTLERVSDGKGFVYAHTYEELMQYDFGRKFGEKFAGLKITTFEAILQKFGGRTIMNIEFKPLNAATMKSYCREVIDGAVALIRKYECENWVYLSSRDDDLLCYAREIAPDITRCVLGGSPERTAELVERAQKTGSRKIQFGKNKFKPDLIERAHEHGLICNIFGADTPEEAELFLNMGIDTILTNDYNLIANKVREVSYAHHKISIW